MADIDLKLYTTHAKELEVAILTQKKLMKSQENIILEQHPQKPKKKEITVPTKPNGYNKTHGDYVLLWWGIAGVSVGAIGLLLGLLCGFQWPVILLLIIGLLGIIGILFGMKEKRFYDNLNKISEENYKKEIKNYPHLMETYSKELALAEDAYQREINNYNSNVKTYNQSYQKTMNQHRDALSTLEKALDNLYNENIIFPKYRNLVAITAINEYLLSGRCKTLEGPDGAYNLYETELRQNIIITQLSNILDNLEQIKCNQFSLYQELQKSNAIINEILVETRNMNNTAKLTAYFAGITALATTSPKYYHGIIH